MTGMSGENAIVRGKRIFLSPLEEEDLDRSRRWVNDKSLWPLLLRHIPVTRKDQGKWYRKILSDPSKFVFAVRTARAGRHIGNTGFYEIDPTHRRANFWILIGDKNYWRKGFGMETIRGMIWYGFMDLNFNKIYLDVSEDNKAAITAYKKSGFSQEGLFRQHCFVGGRYRNVLRMAMLRKDHPS